MKKELDEQSVAHTFDELVNMTPRALEQWLQTEESKSVGWDSGDGESVGHKSGEHIVQILHKKKSERTDADYAHMQKVAGYIKRHLAQRPHGEVSDTRWAYSLKNWGHDPGRD